MTRTLLALTVLGTLTGAARLSAADRPPNVVIVFADDLGYADLGCFGATNWNTPHLDSLARDGVRFTDFHTAQPVCSASRTALLTGCYPNRLGLHGALGPKAAHGISAAETTLAEVAKSKGYATAAVGKWHLGHHPQFLPTRHGFDSYLGLPYSNDMWPHHPEAKAGTYPPLPLIEDDRVIDSDVTPEDQTTLTARYTERAVKFIAANKDRPFLLYLAHSMPHVPLFAGAKFRGSSRGGVYGDVIQEIDWSVGEVLAALKANGVENDTLVMFTSDNGPWLSYGNHGGSAGPLRAGKGTVFEGGVRVPFVARWPGKIPAGTVCREPTMTIDVLPTVAKLIGAELPKLPIDGKDIGPLLRGEPGAKCPHEAYHFYYGVNELRAVRSGKWKLMLPHTSRTMVGQSPGKDGTPGRYANEKLGQELYDLDADVGETTDVAAKHPDVVQRLLGYAERMRADLGDALTKRDGPGRREPGRLAAADNPPAGYKLLYSQDFAKPDAVKDFAFTDPAAWKLASGDRPALELVKQSAYKPPHRSPVNIALVGGKVFGDCVIECDCLQTGREYGHRDMVFVFGYQSPAKFYYAHIATKADPNANNVFVVNDAPRKNIATQTNPGNDWGLNKWHKVRVERKASDGTVAVFFDDMATPVMRAKDPTHGAGWVGFGSFDDTGKVANIKVWGPSADDKQVPPFQK